MKQFWQSRRVGLVLFALMCLVLLWAAAGCDDPADARPAQPVQQGESDIDIDIHLPQPVKTVTVPARPGGVAPARPAPVKPAAPNPAAPKPRAAGAETAPTSEPPSCCMIPSSPQPPARPAS